MVDTVCLFQQSTVYAEDMQLLTPPAWLNDHLISFAFDYTYHRVLEEPDDILFIHPTAVFVLAHENDPEDFAATMHNLNFPAYQLVLFAINDNPFVVDTGGSHWSLLILCTASNTFMHFDSAGLTNNSFARHIYKRIANFYGQEMTFISAKSPSQNNGYDCGVFVFAQAEVISQFYVEWSTDEEKQQPEFNVELIEEKLNTKDWRHVSEWRGVLKSRIDIIAEEYQQQQQQV